MAPDNGPMARVRALRANDAPRRPPIRVTGGQRVRVGERDSTWPAFVFVTTEDGGSGWVPSRHIDTSSDPPVMLAPCDTTELPTSPGEVLAVQGPRRSERMDLGPQLRWPGRLGA